MPLLVLCGGPFKCCKPTPELICISLIPDSICISRRQHSYFKCSKSHREINRIFNQYKDGFLIHMDLIADLD